MAEIRQPARKTIPEEVMLARLAQSEQMREFFIEMWRQNPALAKQGGARVESLLAPLEQPGCTARHQRGISLVELIMFIVIVSVALAGILLVFNVTTKGSADPLIHKQALAAAESLLEEIQLQDFSPPSGVVATGTVKQGDRASGYHIVNDYNMPGGVFPSDKTKGIFPLSSDIAILGTPISGLENYTAKVDIAESDLGTGADKVLAGSAVLITVTVTVPQGTDIEISGYRTDYCCSKDE